MESYFGEDLKRINHAKQVLGHAEKLLEKYPDANRDIIVAAAILHDIGIPEAMRKYGSSMGRFQEIEGPPIARKIMRKLGVNDDKINEVCEIVGHHHTPGKIKTLNFKILSDSDWLVNIADDCDIENKDGLKKLIEKVFLTDAGMQMANEIYL